jgi:hypothetical protein
MAANHHFSEPVELHEDKLFTTDRRVNGLDVHAGTISGSHVVDVSDAGDIQWEQAAELAGAQFAALAGRDVALMARTALIRGTLRPAGQGAGRDRWR